MNTHDSTPITLDELSAWSTLRRTVYPGLTPDERAVWDRIAARRLALSVEGMQERVGQRGGGGGGMSTFNRVMFSSASDEWATPEETYRALDAEFHFADDPCTLGGNVNGLLREWVSPCFVNPPYSDISPWMEKAAIEAEAGKAVVMGLLERHGEVRTVVVDSTSRWSLQPHVREHVKAGAHVFTDALPSYAGLDPEYVHNVIDHAECYVKGNVHTNGIENFWALFKRCIKGTHISIEPFHLFRYLDAQSFRFNNRKVKDGERFAKVLGSIAGKRLTYKALIGEGPQVSAA